jgi:hypothetical protein
MFREMQEQKKQIRIYYFSDWRDSHLFDWEGQEGFWIWSGANQERRLGWNYSVVSFEEDVKPVTA